MYLIARGPDIQDHLHNDESPTPRDFPRPRRAERGEGPHGEETEHSEQVQERRPLVYEAASERSVGVRARVSKRNR